MVRLKGNIVTKYKVRYDYFNSNMVRLKVSPSAYLMSTLLHFNSNMVRLKGLKGTK